MAGIYSDIASDVLSGMSSGPPAIHSILRSRYGVRVQDPSTASCARDMDVGSTHPPLHPELPIWSSSPGMAHSEEMKRRRRSMRKKKEEEKEK